MCPTVCTPWIAAHQAPLSMEFSRQEYWSGLPFPSSGDLSNPGMEPESLALASAAAWEAPNKHLAVLCLVAQLCPILCNPVDCSLPGSSVRGIFQARMLEWIAISYFRGSFQPRDGTLVSCVSCIDRWILYHVPPGKSHYCIRDLYNGTFVISSLN